MVTRTRSSQAATQPSKEVAEKKQTTDLVSSGMMDSFEDQADAGYEEADQDSYAIPFIKLLQKMSPEVDEAAGEYVEGAKAGMFYNSSNGDLADGKTGILILPLHFVRRFHHWAPREEGGGYLGRYSPAEAEGLKTTRDSRGREAFEDGTYLMDTREHYVFWLSEDRKTWEGAVIALASTQIKKSKKWMTAMRNFKLQKKDGTYFTPPSFARVWRATAVPESNEQGSWFGWKFEPVGLLRDEDIALFEAAKILREAIAQGEVKVQEPASPTEDYQEDVGF